MNRQEIYRDWVRTHRATETNPDFAETVMERIDRADTHRHARVTRWSAWLESMADSSWAQAAGVAVATALGLGRILLTLHVLSFG